MCIAQRASEDPICRLTVAQKLRLCAIVFGSSLFRQKKVKFTPILDNVQSDCVKKRIFFLTDINAYIQRESRIYKEWVIGCRVLTEERNETTYYVSRFHGFRNWIFLFINTEITDRVAVYKYFRNVSLVDRLQSNTPRTFLLDDVED